MDKGPALADCTPFPPGARGMRGTQFSQMCSKPINSEHCVHPEVPTGTRTGPVGHPPRSCTAQLHTHCDGRTVHRHHRRPTCWTVAIIHPPEKWGEAVDQQQQQQQQRDPRRRLTWGIAQPILPGASTGPPPLNEWAECQGAICTPKAIPPTRLDTPTHPATYTHTHAHT